MSDTLSSLSIDTLQNHSVSEALRLGAAFLDNSETPDIDARALMKCALDIDDAALIMGGRENMSKRQCEAYLDFLNRRKNHEPVAYITGVKEFWSLEFRVTPDVLIPRSDSECLIEAAVGRRERNETLRILDLGTGSGCLLCALLSEFPNAEGIGVDISDGAVALASDNARLLGVANHAAFLTGNWLEPVSGVFDIIVINAPYIPDGHLPTLSRGVAGYEPHSALFSGENGLHDYETIMPQLPRFLADKGLLLMECGSDQTQALSDLVAGAGLCGGETFTIFDLAGRRRGVGFDRRKGQNRD
ncbi:peptide chain release factor N(5)-glutamine methyltransferase [Hyphococcus flavus]|uniref:Release factor glutamine methyltransferase n=1 Tax=Hyphococcus flavus TaxID=1866326 RepID=A0AAF0CF59_9PROT|nr:peptide chain release factor N(5)-glutamine methyltransferase [Hyphococcus flavus]WDI30508.1 peptide chain release factor N(5)-glutamine methyltransferase [Hyphococcus flavus]